MRGYLQRKMPKVMAPHIYNKYYIIVFDKDICIAKTFMFQELLLTRLSTEKMTT
jgi:hypothetical protein